jgi:hypothetical protein
MKAMGWILGLCLLAPAPGAAQGSCRSLCGPSVTLMPALNQSHLFGGPQVRSLADGTTHELGSRSNFELIVGFGIRTAIPRTSLYASVQWLPSADEKANPYTLYTASEVGEQSLRANAPTLSAGVSFALLTPAMTGKWLDLSANVGDLFSQAARPDAQSSYSHKLDLGLLAHLTPLAHTSVGGWLSRVSLFGLLDYVATGLPKAGDEVPKGERVYVTDARPATLIVGLALPLTPAQGF